MSRWIVVLKTGRGHRYAYGPLDEQEMAEQFADFLSTEVDPAEAVKLIDPVDELIAYWRNHRIGGLSA